MRHGNSNWQNFERGRQVDQQTANEMYKEKQKEFEKMQGLNHENDNRKMLISPETPLYVIAAIFVIAIVISVIWFL